MPNNGTTDSVGRLFLGGGKRSNHSSDNKPKLSSPLHVASAFSWLLPHFGDGAPCTGIRLERISRSVLIS